MVDLISLIAQATFLLGRSLVVSIEAFILFSLLKIFFRFLHFRLVYVYIYIYIYIYI